jgi:hypothetical protein
LQPQEVLLMLALSIRQPFAEMILRGIKTVEYRSRPTRLIGQRFYIYASKTQGTKGVASPATGSPKIWSSDLKSGHRKDNTPPGWMLELAAALKMFPMEDLADLPRGVIVGTAVIDRVTPPSASSAGGMYQWHLKEIERAKRLRRPTSPPQPVWFQPF